MFLFITIFFCFAEMLPMFGGIILESFFGHGTFFNKQQVKVVSFAWHYYTLQLNMLVSYSSTFDVNNNKYSLRPMCTQTFLRLKSTKPSYLKRRSSVFICFEITLYFRTDFLSALFIYLAELYLVFAPSIAGFFCFWKYLSVHRYHTDFQLHLIRSVSFITFQSFICSAPRGLMYYNLMPWYFSGYLIGF